MSPSPYPLHGLLALCILPMTCQVAAKTLTVFHEARPVARIDVPAGVDLTITSDAGKQKGENAPTRFHGHVEVKLDVKGTTVKLSADEVELSP